MASETATQPSARRRVTFPHLDIVKLVMALLVVEIHVKPLSAFGSGAIDAIASAVDCVAVPFFFIASAFLCFRGMEPATLRDPSSREAARVRATAKKLLLLYAAWFALYLPFAALEAALEGTGAARFAALELRGLLLVGEGVVSWPLWYLLASAVGLALVYVLLRGVSLWFCQPETSRVFRHDPP